MHKVYAIVVLLSVSGCHGGDLMMNRTDDERFSADGPQYEVQLTPRLESRAAPEDRRAEEQAAIEEILRRTPRNHQGRMKEILDDRNATFVSSSDPEVARLLGTIASIRAVDNTVAIERGRAAMLSDLEDQKRRVTVTLVLVPSLPTQDARAVVLRRPQDNGRPLLLLSATDATPADLRLGLRAAAAAFVRYGPSPISERRVLVKPVTESIRWEAASHSEMITKLRASPLRVIPGLGSLRAMEVVTRTTRDRG
jgi:hypothetical protein